MRQALSAQSFALSLATFAANQFFMGAFRQTIKLMNAYDPALLREGNNEEQRRQMEVSFLIDSGAFMMCINQGIQLQLGLPVVGERKVLFADGRKKIIGKSIGLEIRVFNRRTLTDDLVLPGNSEPLFGNIALEARDVIINLKAGELKLPPDRLSIPMTMPK